MGKFIIEQILMWLGLLIGIYLFYEIFVIRKEKVLNNMKDGKELTLLAKKYHLNYDKLPLKQFVRVVAITNAFIVSTVATLVFTLQLWIENILLWMLLVLVVGMVLLVPLILFLYSRIGKYYAKKQKGGK